mgnify:CR=1 FL=1
MPRATLKLALIRAFVPNPKSELVYKDLMQCIIRIVYRDQHEEKFYPVQQQLRLETTMLYEQLDTNPLDRVNYDVFERVHPARTQGVFDYQPRYEETRAWGIKTQLRPDSVNYIKPCYYWTIMMDWEATEDRFNEYLENSDIKFSAMVDAVVRFRKCRRYQVN